jgi:hypothetical protein
MAVAIAVAVAVSVACVAERIELVHEIRRVGWTAWVALVA